LTVKNRSHPIPFVVYPLTTMGTQIERRTLCVYIYMYMYICVYIFMYTYIYVLQWRNRVCDDMCVYTTLKILETVYVHTTVEILETCIYTHDSGDMYR